MGYNPAARASYSSSVLHGNILEQDDESGRRASITSAKSSQITDPLVVLWKEPVVP